MTPRMIYQVPETRERILGIAKDIFVAQGFFSVTMTDIADAAGISRTSLYRYFQDKLDLGLAVSRELLREIPAASPDYVASVRETTPDGLSEVERWIELMWVTPDGDDIETFFAEFDSYFSGERLPEDFVERWSEILDELPSLADSFAGAVARGIADGTVRPDVDAMTTVASVTNAMRGLNHRLLLRNEAFVEMQGIENQAVLETMKDVIVRGLKADETT